MLALVGVTDTLGLDPLGNLEDSPLSLVSWIEEGLPVAALDRVSRLLAPTDNQFKYRIVPKATYERRKSSLRLSPEEGTRLARIARVWNLALDIWQDPEEARAFLFRPHAMLRDRPPIEVVIQNELGAELVFDILGALKYGSAA